MKLGLKLNGTPLDKMLLVLALSLLAICMFLYIKQRTASPALSRLTAQVESARKDLQAARNYPDPEILKKEILGLQAKTLTFPDADKAEETMASLWNWSRDSGVVLEQIALNNTVSTVGDWAYPAHNFPMSGKGDPANVFAFLKLLTDSPLKTVGISQLQIGQKTEAEWQFSLVYTVWSEGTKIVVTTTTPASKPPARG